MADRKTTHATPHFVGAYFVLLLALSGLASCGGGGGATTSITTTATTTALTPPDPAITSFTNPHTIGFNTTTSIAWTSSDASSCTLYDTTATAGVISTGTNPAVPGTITLSVANGTATTWTTPAPLTTSKTYTLQCLGAAGTNPTQQAVTVTVTPLAVITFFSATPSAITIGSGQQSTTLTWSSQHSTGCALTGTGAPGGTLPTVSGASPVTVDFSSTPAGTYPYVMTCLGTGGTVPASQSIDVTVAPAPPAGTINPSITQFLTLQPTISLGQSSTLNWISANSTSCNLSAGGAPVPGAPPSVSGSFSVSPAATTTYILSCTGATGTTPASQNTTVTVVVPSPPTANIIATPSIITSGQSTSITWSSTYSSSCRFTAGAGTNPATVLAISGAITPVLTSNSTYTVECTGPGGTVSASAPVTVNPVGGGGGCTTTGATGAITLSNVVSRLNGVAPLSVFFDATDTVATTTTKPFHDLEYRWDFGDRTGGVLNFSPPLTGTSTWNTGSRPTGSANASSRNTATGPVAAHVYETPGTYTVTLVATDGTNSVTNTCTQIVVQNPDDAPGVPGVFSGANTVCVGATSLPAAGVGGCPSGAVPVMLANFTTAINTHAKTGKRVLFKRGDTFFSTPYIPASGVPTGASITATGPGIVGAFGVGAPPVVRPSEANGNLLLGFSDRTTPNLKDWRVMDLELDGMSTGSGSRIYSSGVGFGGGANQITLLRLHIHDTYATGIGNSTSTLDHNNNTDYTGHKMWDQIAVVDSQILRNRGDGSGNGGCGMYFASLRFSLLGTTVDDVTRAEHVLRFPYLDKAVISNNILSRQAANKHVIKLLAPTWNWACASPPCAYPVGDANDPDIAQYHGVNSVVSDTVNGVSGYTANGASGYTEHIVISDNHIENGSGAAWAIVVGPKNSAGDERVRDVIAERNRFVSSTNSGDQLMFVVQDSVTETTARNNICDMSAATGTASCFSAGKSGSTSLGTPPDRFRIYNNTAYSATAAVFRFMEIKTFPPNFSPPTNITLQNNLVYAPSAIYTPLALVWTTCPGPACPEQLNNSTATQIKNTSPLFAATPPVSTADYTPLAGSYAINTGAPVPVWSDFFGLLRPQSGVPGTIDMGAIDVAP